MAKAKAVTFSSPSGKVRQVAAKRTARVLNHYQHTRYVRAFTTKFRAH